MECVNFFYKIPENVQKEKVAKAFLGILFVKTIVNICIFGSV